MPGPFILTGKVRQIVKDSADAGIAEDIAVATGWTAQLSCNVSPKQAVPYGDDVVYVDVRTVTLLSDGSISEDGVNPGISLLAHDPDEFDNQVQWTIKPSQLTLMSGKLIRPRAWTFDAPLQGETVTLGEVTPVPPQGLVVTRGQRGLPGDVAGIGPYLATAVDPLYVGRKRPAARTAWYTKADTTAIPSTEDTGQDADVVVTPGAVARIENGGFTYTPPASGGSGVYREFTDDEPITRIGARFNMGGHRVGTTRQTSVCLATMNRGPLDGANTSTRINVHFTVSPDSWAFSTVNGTTGTMVFDFIASGLFSPPLAVDDTEYVVEMYRDGNTVTLVLPNGDVRTVTNANIGGAYVGNWGFVEWATTNSGTDCVGLILEHWWDTGVQYPPTSLDVPAQKRDLAPYALITGAPVRPKTHLSVPGYFEFGDKAACPRYPAICLIGDSMVGNSYNRTDWTGVDLSRTVAFKGDGFFNQGMVYADQPATWWSMGLGGRTSAQVLAGFDSEIPQYQPQIILIHCANNDIAANATAPQIFANLVALVQKSWDIGAKVILCNTFVRVGATATQQKVTHALNSMIYQMVAANPSDLALVDVYSTYADPATGFPRGDLTDDGVHLNSKGAYVVGKLLEPILDRFCYNPSSVLAYSAVSDETNIVPNAFLTGTTGFKFANNGLVGNLADGWFMNSNSTDASFLCTLSKVPAADGYGEWQQQTTTTATAGLQTTMFTEATTGFVAGDVVQGSVRFETDAAGWGNGVFDLNLLCYNATPQYLMKAMANAAPASEVIIKTRMERGTLVTPPFVVPVGTTKIAPYLLFGSTGTVRWGRPAIRKLNKVAF